MPQNRETRRLTQNKQNTIEFKKGRPLNSQGDNGDITIRQLDDGVFLFFKALGKWYKTLNTSSQVIPEPDAPSSFVLGNPSQPVQTMYVSSHSIHMGDTKREQTKISTDGTDLVFKNKAGTERKVVGKKANSTAGDIEHTITLGVDNTSGGEGILALGTGASNNGGIISSSTNWASTPSVHGLRVMNTTSSGATMRSILQAKTSFSVAIAKAGVRLCTYNGPAGAITLDGSSDSTDPSGLANTGTLWANSSDLPYWKAGTGTAYELLTSNTGLPLSGGAMTGAITTNSTFDGVDIATRDAILTSTTLTANACLPKAGGTMSGDLNIAATDKLTFDGGGDTYIKESSADVMLFMVGNDNLLLLKEEGTAGNTAWFKTGCVGFTRIQAPFSGSIPINSGGTDDTNIDFRHSNKFRLEMTGDINQMNLIFPAVSGNFLLVCTTNGDHDVTDWKVWESDESAATTTDVMWAGGSVPAFTSSGIDIVSFYWDTEEQQAYGTASLAFATP